MKKFLSVCVLCSMLLVGCGGKASGSETSEFVVGGSTSIQPLMEQIAESYNKSKSGKITVQGGGSSVGTKGAMDGTFSVGMASRALKEEEEKSLEGTVIALDGIVIIVNKDNPITNITLEQAKQIYTGKITNWKDIGGKDQEIAVVSREEGSGTRDGFESIVGFESSQLIANADIQNATGAVISNVSGNKQAIGYISMGSMSNNIKGLTIDGVEASEATILDETYKLQRPFMLCVKKGDESAKALFDFIFSDEGKQIIQEHKYIPVEREG
ncbi:phosphate transport system substrate-binding protein [Breznakia sp. PF5-3]|uniref:phosphate ABC transporter substrate-binding protein n=1 Tax=unclassified Breznakia TaxID=2623764 RepID=UPI0024055941|nr:MULTISPECIES: phosphate ABC transporter substrate-binding protein [unclassified Breznakia]MDF9825093.1 phosphate transport system substrate-binding protein [Breznakia sp. PM6-1]MDF9835930.1 phosphate transport system substrate-binding protein [Breznakia sp. PF5-3]MDF9837468.1 phosphate transport system substrate-binding protein [Breznakia sp. PFB2-8]MDF9859469.1 phosphate transport system substrate-binding protein [Breznakia sp. PH5-24]